MTHLLDPDTCIGVLRQRPGMGQRLSQVAPTDCAVSMVTVHEVFCGVEKVQDPAKERQKVERFVSALIELPLDPAAAETATRIPADLERQVQPIGPYDLLIAGQALASGLTLGTNNCQEFQRNLRNKRNYESASHLLSLPQENDQVEKRGREMPLMQDSVASV